MNNIISHPIPPIWNSESRILILGTMPSPKSRDFLLRHHLALWDVLASCGITGAADSSIKNAIPNDFTKIFDGSKIHHIICTGKTSHNLWQKKMRSPI